MIIRLTRTPPPILEITVALLRTRRPAPFRYRHHVRMALICLLRGQN